MMKLASVSLLVAALSLPACQKAENRKIAEVDGQAILISDLEKASGRDLFKERERLYLLEKQKLDEYIGALLLTREAQKHNMSVATLLDQQVHSKVLAVADDEIEAFYRANKNRFSVGVEKVRDNIREYLRNQKIEAQKSLYFKSLRANANIITYLKPPPIYRADLSIKGDPFKGPETAPVTIVKFEDFQCPFCKQGQPIFAELLSRYNGKIRVVHKDLPLDSIHPQARPAAEAARCAQEQQKFWDYHDKLYASAPHLAAADLKTYAKEVGLDLGLFERCLNAGKYKELVQNNLMQGAKLGITGTPTFFINGREVSGAQPIEAFTTIIDEELAQAK
ncbi:MAG TPA: DsbA family protein [Candidatus Binatia bacterium]|nr:DsbA family protein [Candidatus Binatia bacterium]